MFILYRFRDIATYLLEVANFANPVVFGIPVRVTLLEFHQGLWRKKIKSSGRRQVQQSGVDNKGWGVGGMSPPQSGLGSAEGTMPDSPRMHPM